LKIGKVNMKLIRLSPLVLASLAFAFSLAVCAQAQTITYIADFNGTNGWLPFSSVVQGTDGNFYGTTSENFGNGNVFQATPAGGLRSIYRFCSQPNCSDGIDPTSLILGSDGNLYGTTGAGGSDAGSMYGSGTIFKMTLSGSLTTLYTFCTVSPCTDGENPKGLTLASDGNFYGTADGGAFLGGTVFRLSPSGEFSVLYSFCALANCADGGGPSFPPIQGTDGNFYGTTSGGGTLEGGVAYQLTPSGKYTVLHDFCNDSSGNCPDGNYLPTITQGADGNFYGITEVGGHSDNGVV
jgi:uncharacterized repeat protein (TIGR03803 family)